MNLVFYLSALCLICSFVLTWLVRHWAIKKSIIDHPNERSSHTIPTPRGGGIAIAVSWFLGITLLFINKSLDNQLYFAFLSGIPLTLIGFLDDIFNLKPSVRFIVQFICGIAALFFVGGLKSFDLGFISLEYKFILTPLALIAIVWAINLFNFLDGIDGYLSAEIIFIGTSVFLLFHDSIALILIFSVVGFLFWNWQKAKIFMGDVGSTLLGFNVAVLAIYYQNLHISSIIFWIILTSLFWFDATVTLIRRKLNKENLGKAHRKHAFQRIVQFGYSHQKTVLYSLVVNIIIFVFAFASLKYPQYAMVFLFFDVIFLFFVMKAIDKRKPFEYN